jgi:hypothetical protein
LHPSSGCYNNTFNIWNIYERMNYIPILHLTGLKMSIFHIKIAVF